MLPFRPILEVPLRRGLGGTIRIGNTRVTLDAVVTAFQSGVTADEIRCQFPTLRLADIYSVIGFYLCRTPEVDSYLSARAADARGLRGEIEARFNSSGMRSRLLARLSGRG